MAAIASGTDTAVRMVLRLAGGDERREVPSAECRVPRVRRGDGDAGQAAPGVGGERLRNSSVYMACWPLAGARGPAVRKGGRGVRRLGEDGKAVAGPALSEVEVLELTAATRCHFDRAHLVRGVDGLLVGAVDLGATMTRARRYPRRGGHLNSRGVAFDSQFDELFRRQIELDGVTGIGGLSGMFVAASASGVRGDELARAAAEARRRGLSLPELAKTARYVRNERGKKVRDAAIVAAPGVSGWADDPEEQREREARADGEYELRLEVALRAEIAAHSVGGGA